MKSFAQMTSRRGFASTVTVKLPNFELYRLQESQMPKTATTNKQELMAYFTRMS